MARVTREEGTIAAYVWDYAGKMELMRFFWDAAVELDPSAAKLDEGVRFPLCRPEALEKLFASAGLGEVEVKAIDIPTLFANFDDYWQPFLGGQGPPPPTPCRSTRRRGRACAIATGAHADRSRRVDLVDRTGLGSSRERCKACVAWAERSEARDVTDNPTAGERRWTDKGHL